MQIFQKGEKTIIHCNTPIERSLLVHELDELIENYHPQEVPREFLVIATMIVALKSGLVDVEGQ